MKLTKYIRGYLLTGLAIWLPILATFVVVRFIIDILDGTIALLPHAYQPEQLLGTHLPGLGVIVSFFLLMITGIIGTNFFGAKLVQWGEMLLSRIPLVRSIYNAVKQVVQTIFSSNSQAFRKVMMVEYPRYGMWSIGFLTSVCNEEARKATGEDLIAVFIPTTPNPTSGFLVMVPRINAIELDMSVDEALKFIISLGVMQPISALTEAPTTQIG